MISTTQPNNYMSTPTDVTDLGTNQDLHLESNDVPSTEHLVSLDQAFEKAGLGDMTGKDLIEASSPNAVSTEDSPEVTEDATEVEGDKTNTPGDKEPPTPTPDPKKDASVDDEAAKKAQELEALDLDAVKPPPNVSPKNLVNFDKLRDVAKHFKQVSARVPELEAKVAELEAKAPALLPDIAKELEDHRNFRRLFDTENDPEFKKQFDEKLTSIDNDLFELLRRNGLSEDLEKQMRQLGIDKINPSWLEKTILERLPIIDRNRVSRRLAERADLVDSRAKEIEKFTSQRGEYLQQEQAKQTQAFEAEQAQIQEHLATLVKDTPWAQYKEVPAKATAEERKQIEAHNQQVKELEENFQQALYPRTPQARAEVAAAASASVRLARAVNFLEAELKEVTAARDAALKEVEKIKTASRLPATKVPARKSASESIDTSKLSDEDAVERGLAEAEAN